MAIHPFPHTVNPLKKPTLKDEKQRELNERDTNNLGGPGGPGVTRLPEVEFHQDGMPYIPGDRNHSEYQRTKQDIRLSMDWDSGPTPFYESDTGPIPQDTQFTQFHQKQFPLPFRPEHKLYGPTEETDLMLPPYSVNSMTYIERLPLVVMARTYTFQELLSHTKLLFPEMKLRYPNPLTYVWNPPEEKEEEEKDTTEEELPETEETPEEEKISPVEPEAPPEEEAPEPGFAPSPEDAPLVKKGEGEEEKIEPIEPVAPEEEEKR